MTDTHTRRALDALADLLLTGPAPAMDLSGRRQPAQSPAPQAPRHDPLAASDLRLTPQPVAPLAVEAVMLGHLPGYASPWISQYAHEMALRHGGAALLRMDGRQVRIEVFDGTSAPTPADQPRSDEDFMQALCRVASRVGAWLVMVDPPDAPVSRKRLGELDRWTLLTGSDEAAVIASYRLLKTLTDRPDTRAPRRGVGFMFMGCDPEPAADAMARIERATQAFLDVPVELAGVRKQMQPARRSYVGQFELDEEPWSLVLEFLHDLSVDAENGYEPGSDPAASTVSAEPALRLSEPLVIDPVAQPAAEPVAEPVAEPMPEPTVQATIDELPASPGPSTPPASPLTPSIAPSPAVALAAASPHPLPLSSYAKLTPMTARCPRHEEVELALDEVGTIHLLMQANADAVDAALRTLEETRRWTMEHRKLLELTVPAQPLAGGEPVTHLFTDEPSRAAGLAFSGPSEARRMKLHLLKPLVVGAQTVQVHAEIN